jgi:hypothetical protein
MASTAPTSYHPSGFFQAIVPGRAQPPLNISASSVQSLEIPDNTSLVRLFPTVDCFIEFGDSPTATTSSHFFPGGLIQYVGVDVIKKIAVIKAGTPTGTLYIMEGA